MASGKASLVVASGLSIKNGERAGSAEMPRLAAFAGQIVEARKPGEILDWTMTSENQGTGPALEYKTVGHIPRGTEFVPGSPKGDGAKTVFSIDGGKSFSPQPMIEEKQADGSSKLVPAPASSYTQLRYEWSIPLEPGQKISATYQVRVK